MKDNFYCQKRTGEYLEINEWNERYEICKILPMSIQERNDFLFPKPCDQQCEECLNIVLDTRLENKRKYNW